MANFSLADLSFSLLLSLLNGDCPHYTADFNRRKFRPCPVVRNIRLSASASAIRGVHCKTTDMPNNRVDEPSTLYSHAGLCYTSKFDPRYSWTGEMLNGRHVFRGFAKSHLFWDVSIPENPRWRLELFRDRTVYATTNSTAEYPLGTFDWTFFNEDCYGGKPTTVPINFNACDDDEFNCRDGTCVGIDERCNGNAIK